MSTRARTALSLVLVTAASLVTSGASAAPASPWSDVTRSARGQAAAARAAGLFDAANVPTARSDLRVYDVENGDLVVLPRWVEPASFVSRSVIRNGHPAVEAEASVIIGLQSRRQSAEGVAAVDGHVAGTGPMAAAAYWSQYDSGCFAWLRQGGSYMAPCYYVSKLMNDGNSKRDYFALRQRASLGTQKAGSGNYDGWLMSKRTAGSATQYWADWEPGAEIRGNCGSVNLAVMAKGVTIGISATACDRWEPTLWEAPGHFRNKWNCDCFVGVSGMRQVASNIAVAVPQGRYPSWTISAGFLGW